MPDSVLASYQLNAEVTHRKYHLQKVSIITIKDVYTNTKNNVMIRTNCFQLLLEVQHNKEVDPYIYLQNCFTAHQGNVTKVWGLQQNRKYDVRA